MGENSGVSLFKDWMKKEPFDTIIFSIALNIPFCLIKQPCSKTSSQGYSQNFTAQSHKI